MMVQQGMIGRQGQICLAFSAGDYPVVSFRMGPSSNLKVCFFCCIFVGHDLSFRDICQIKCYLLCSLCSLC